MTRGFLRAWVLITVLWAAIILAACTEYLFLRESCFKFISISRANPAVASEILVATEKAAMSHEFCGREDTNGTLMNLEALAKQGDIVQVAIAWREPRGWSDERQGTIDIFDRPEIVVAEIQARAEDWVRAARFGALSVPLMLAALAPLALLALGAGVYWVFSGFTAR